MIVSVSMSVSVTVSVSVSVARLGGGAGGVERAALSCPMRATAPFTGNLKYAKRLCESTAHSHIQCHHDPAAAVTGATFVGVDTPDVCHRQC